MRTIEAPGATLQLAPHFLPAARAATLFESLRDGLRWRQDTIKVYGREHAVPRLQHWCGEVEYRYSGLRMVAEPWHPALLELRGELERVTGAGFNTCLANLYRDGSDTVGWHADDEAELGPRPTIASVSLGAARDFLLRRKDRTARLKVTLEAGSLLVMSGETQELWEHSIPRRASAGPRINLTFRATRKNL